jgi:flagellar assembly protein FliH
LFKPVLKPADAEGHILNYKPQPLNQSMPQTTLNFVKDQDAILPNSKGFELNELVAETTGLGEIERKNFNTRVESEVLTRLKAIEEKAFAEAYALGMRDGKDKAYTDTSQEIKQAIESIGKIVESVTVIKNQLFVENEAHIVKTIFHVAKALALKEIQSDPKLILNVLKTALENAQSEEEIKLKINPQDNEFIEKVKGEAGNPFERVSKLKVEVTETIARGGCLVETNYGVVDATIDQRIAKLWTVLESKIPKIQEN